MPQEQAAAALDRILRTAPVIPVLTVARVEDAAPLAEALVAGGLPVIEVTLRTPAALDAIRAMQRVAGAVVGAGTVLDPEALRAAIDAGAAFAVSPGFAESLSRAAADTGFPLLPGAATASEIMRARALGHSRLKFFPAEAAGGVPALKALSAAFGDMLFCPTGGVTRDNVQAWLDLPCVICVGGSWLVPAGQAVDFEAVRRRAQAAAALRRP
jgi:2-dehydro-3-deoxyphosphogluconate aldolase / (4S)-4-hydroxy-2-oxoglutarate aldolase